MKNRASLAVFLVAVAASLGVAGCQQPGSIPPPAYFSPSPCPSGWHLLPDAQAAARHEWSCVITGTLAPGQDLPLPVISGTPVQWHGKTPAGSPGQSGGTAS